MRKKLPKSHNKCIGNCEQNPTKQLSNEKKTMSVELSFCYNEKRIFPADYYLNI